MGKPIVSEQQADDFINIRAVQLALKLQLTFQRQALRPVGLPLQEWRILVSLARFGDSHLRKITARAALDPAHASRATASLTKRGLISRSIDPKDSRRRVLSLTAKGLEVFEEAWDHAETLSQDLSAAFTPDEFATFKSLMDRAIRQADALLSKTEPSSKTEITHNAA